jgi:hypothetical protein
MKELVFAMELHGHVTPVEGREGIMSAQTVGRGPQGETVRFTSQVVRQGETSTETGRIECLGRGAVEFDTIGTLHSSPCPLPKHRHTRHRGVSACCFSTRVRIPGPAHARRRAWL